MKPSPNSVRLAEAVHTVNRHAKTAPDNRYLYSLKKAALEKMIFEGLAEKTGLHFVRNPSFSRQQSAVLITCGEFLFHLPATKEDFQTLPHLGDQNLEIRNPKASVSLRAAKQLLSDYTGLKENSDQPESPATPSPRRGVPKKDRRGTASGHRSWFGPLK
ncbi:YkyB family protein [Edaphobacillus lindanitolerans]|uniref:YkyB-like protein n=1 Tax=Edaphobacillus lindanitolerans TaxID=550447 RepID=A0A1U7PJD5_9BACI|nr:YkyB family protein [Edaphobacillus lindanitolerans]SIT68422.1 YkyB-like protein [Edaphobacillus lindanitolerans]